MKFDSESQAARALADRQALQDEVSVLEAELRAARDNVDADLAAQRSYWEQWRIMIEVPPIPHT